MRDAPTPFHINAMWTAITALSITVTVAIVIGFIYVCTQIISFLQPILIPFAVAGVLAYLLEPVVNRLVRWGLNRQRAVLLVFCIVSACLAGVLLLIVPTMVRESTEFVRKVPEYAEKAKNRVSTSFTLWHDWIKQETGIEILDFISGPKQESQQTVTVSTPPQSPTVNNTEPETVTVQKPADAPATTDAADLASGAWLKESLMQMAPATWSFIRRSLGGFLGVFGFLLSFIIVPLYLYYFLTESAVIAQRWSDFVPLRASDLKDEVVDTLSEINGYLIAFFRGQLLVSMINGIATGIGLVIVGLQFGWLIGLAQCILGMIPYLGNVICWIPAVIIASVQGGEGTWITGDPWWVFPLVVTGIFAIVQQIDALFITPQIVGDSVGLHPMTVIISVFLWSLVMGGLLGAILAVPMTAAIKVLFQRYVWQPRFRAEIIESTQVPDRNETVVHP